MDEIFLTGAGVVISSVIVFCGSVWLVLAIVLGARLAYFVTASVTLAFVLIMGVVWSFAQPATPLGPVGTLPEFNEVAIGEGGEVDFQEASAYPSEPWRVPDENDEAETTKASEAENAAIDILEAAITEGKVETFASADEAQVSPDSVRLLEREDGEYAAVLLEPVPEGPIAAPTEPATPDPEAEGVVLTVMKYDPGNPLGLARAVTLGTLILLVLHLFGLSRAEKRARELREQPV